MRITYVYASNYSARVDFVRDDGATFLVERTQRDRVTVERQWRSGHDTEHRPAEAPDVIACLNAVASADLTGWQVGVSFGSTTLSPPPPVAELAPTWDDASASRELPF